VKPTLISRDIVKRMKIMSVSKECGEPMRGMESVGGECKAMQGRLWLWLCMGDESNIDSSAIRVCII
jgi:hypothetical protein